MIRKTKFKKSRLLPLHDSTIEAINRYLRNVAGSLPLPTTMCLFRSVEKNSVAAMLQNSFKNVPMAAGIQGQPNGPKPRLHDFRHRFAVKSLESCHDSRGSLRTLYARAWDVHGTRSPEEYPTGIFKATPLLMRGIADNAIIHHRRSAMTPIAPHITDFLRQRLPVERGASPNTCETYAYTYQLLFEFASQRFKVTPSKLSWNSLMRLSLWTFSPIRISYEATPSHPQYPVTGD